jgi:hypothetical protein
MAETILAFMEANFCCISLWFNLLIELKLVHCKEQALNYRNLPSNSGSEEGGHDTTHVSHYVRADAPCFL